MTNIPLLEALHHTSERDTAILYFKDGLGWRVRKLAGSGVTITDGGEGGNLTLAPTFATPAIVLGSAAAAGAAASVIRSDSTIAAFDTTAPGNITPGAAAAAGTAAFAARRDHTHGFGSILTAYADADQEVTDTTLVSSTELTVTVAASTRYGFRAIIFALNDGAAEGIKLTMAGTATAFSMRAQVYIYDDALNTLAGFGRTTTLGTAVGAGLSSGSNYCLIEGGIQTTAAGTFLVQFAQNATGANAGVHLEVDSNMIVWKEP